MKCFRYVLIAIFIILIGGNLVLIDYGSLFSRKNLSEWLGIISALCMILAMYLSNRHEARHPQH